MTELQWVLGLSIDEELTWGLAKVDPSPLKSGIGAYETLGFWRGIIGNLPNSKTPVPLQFILRDALSTLRRDSTLSPIFDRVKCVGVSTIGVTNHRERRLINIRRKKWKQYNDRGGRHILDFGVLFSETLPSCPIRVHNDATAKCLAHYSFSERSKHDVFCFVNLSEGVNIGIASDIGPLSASHLHPEFGHAYPRWHDHDLKKSEADLRKISGCPAHLSCFEGLASAARLRNEWGDNWRSLSDHGSLPRDVIAYYAAQLCWSATLAIAPSRIIIGGEIPDDDLLDRIRVEFKGLNNGIGKLPYLGYQAIDQNLSSFIRKAERFPVKESKNGPNIRDIGGLMGAFELARFELRSSEMKAQLEKRIRARA